MNKTVQIKARHMVHQRMHTISPWTEVGGNCNIALRLLVGTAMLLGAAVDGGSRLE